MGTIRKTIAGKRKNGEPNVRKGPAPAFTEEEVIKAIFVEQGLLSNVAKRLRCDLSTVHNYVRKYPAVKTALDDARYKTGDLAEQKLFEAIKRGDQWAVSLYLRTVVKDRGYVERSEVAGVSSAPIIVNINRVPRRESLDDKPEPDSETG